LFGSALIKLMLAQPLPRMTSLGLAEPSLSRAADAVELVRGSLTAALAGSSSDRCRSRRGKFSELRYVLAW
jgi:hypothetical protein